jgi:general secretion pathway protein J
MMRSPSQSGFTLAETLVALFVLAIVSAAGTGLLMGASSSSKQLRDKETEIRTLDMAQAFLRNDIAALSMRATVPETGFGAPGNLFGNASDQRGPILAFVRSGWVNPQNREDRSTLQHVEYRLENNTLIRTATVRPDAVTGTPRVERVLLEGVSRIDVRFLRGGEWSREWQGDAGQGLHILPDLIELEIVLEDERELVISSLTGGRV